MNSIRAFTAADPSGNLLPFLTRLRERSVKDAVAEFLRSRPKKSGADNWPEASRLGWRVVPVTVTMQMGFVR